MPELALEANGRLSFPLSHLLENQEMVEEKFNNSATDLEEQQQEEEEKGDISLSLSMEEMVDLEEKLDSLVVSLPKRREFRIDTNISSKTSTPPSSSKNKTNNTNTSSPHVITTVSTLEESFLVQNNAHSLPFYPMQHPSSSSSSSKTSSPYLRPTSQDQHKQMPQSPIHPPPPLVHYSSTSTSSSSMIQSTPPLSYSSLSSIPTSSQVKELLETLNGENEQLREEVEKHQSRERELERAEESIERFKSDYKEKYNRFKRKVKEFQEVYPQERLERELGGISNVAESKEKDETMFCFFDIK